MPTLFTHPAVPLALAAALGTRRIPPRLLAAGIVAAILPDADVVTFSLRIPYDSMLGHRGFTHSVAFAAAIAVVASVGARWLKASVAATALFLFVATLSHPLLDGFTNGGRGVALGWPLSDARWFAPFRPVQVSPIGTHFFSARGVPVIVSELLWIWLPCAAIGFAGWMARRRDLDHR
ncbi:MAG: metal-dependent hydrolase [Burkholderiales bacterium]|nr:metal-dependent hydrolase [Burkholderiales bacterium]